MRQLNEDIADAVVALEELLFARPRTRSDVSLLLALLHALLEAQARLAIDPGGAARALLRVHVEHGLRVAREEQRSHGTYEAELAVLELAALLEALPHETEGRAIA